MELRSENSREEMSWVKEKKSLENRKVFRPKRGPDQKKKSEGPQDDRVMQGFLTLIDFTPSRRVTR